MPRVRFGSKNAFFVTGLGVVKFKTARILKPFTLLVAVVLKKTGGHVQNSRHLGQQPPRRRQFFTRTIDGGMFFRESFN